MDLGRSMQISAAGMKAQGTRLRVISENIANAASTAETPNDLPYRRKVVTFQNAMDRALGVNTVQVKDIEVDSSDFRREYMPGHPAADAEGYVLTPNVNTLIEMNDLREAQRSYQANLSMIQSTKQMLTQTIELLRR